MFVLSGAFGCHMWPAHAVQALPEEVAEAGNAGRIDPETTAAEHACEDQHDVHACTQAAERYWKGKNGHVFDPGKSFRYAAGGCAGGDGLACAILGEHYQNGLGTAWSPTKAIDSYERSCSAGTGSGCFALGAMYAHGYGVDVDRATAKAYDNRAHEQWLSACLGTEPRWCTHAARSTREGEPTAHELDQRACDHGVADGCIAVLHEQLTHPAGSRNAAMRELDPWCRRGQPAACKELASAYELPDGFQDSRRAGELTRQACLLGDSDACVSAGLMHEIERDVPKDDAVARGYFRRACEHGASRGCLYLAQDTFVAGGSEHEIARLAQRGCEMGNTNACDMLIQFFIAVHDETAVMRWATEACRMGSRTACQRLIERDAELPKTVYDPVMLYHDACKAKIRSACLRLPPLVQAEDDVLRGVVAAVAKQDTAAFAKLVAGEIDVRGLRFDDPDCATKFSGTVALTAAQHPGFLRCLAKLAMHVDPAPDYLSTPSLAYEPGGTLVVEMLDGVVQRIQASPSSPSPRQVPSSVSPMGGDPSGVPRNVAPKILEALRITGQKAIYPDPDTRKALAASSHPRLVGSFKVCITTRGSVESVAVMRSTGSISYDRKIERTMYAWKYRPFLVDGEPVNTCTAVTFIYSQR